MLRIYLTHSRIYGHLILYNSIKSPKFIKLWILLPPQILPSTQRTRPRLQHGRLYSKNRRNCISSNVAKGKRLSIQILRTQRLLQTFSLKRLQNHANLHEQLPRIRLGTPRPIRILRIHLYNFLPKTIFPTNKSFQWNGMWGYTIK